MLFHHYRKFIRWLVLALVLVPGGTAAQAQQADAFTIPVPDRQIATSPMDTVVYSPDGSRIASGGRDNLVRLLDTASGEQQGMLVGHRAWVSQIAFSPDGNIIATGSHDSTVRLWDSHSFSEVQRLNHHSGQVTGVAFSPGGQLLATASTDGTVWIGEAATGDEIATLINYSGPVWSIAFSPDGGSLVSGSEDGTIWWWGLYDSSLTRLEGHTGAITALVFSPDRRYLATSSWDRSIRLWDTLTGGLLNTLVGHQGPVTDLVFDGEGTQLLSTGLDGTLRLWDVGSGLQRAVLQSDAPLSGLAYDRHNAQAITAGIYGVLGIWDIGGRVETLIQAQPTAAPVLVQAPTLIAPTIVPPPPTEPVVVQSTVIPQPPTAVAVQPTAILPPATAIPAPQVVSNAGGPSIAAPTINLFSAITTFPLDGVSWAIDPWENRVGHFQGTAWTSTPGNIALGGHSLFPDGSRGIFNGLYALNIGDPIVFTADGVEQRYVVSEKFTVHYTDLSVVYPTPTPRLTLVTCDIPTWNADIQNYEQRLIVVAVPG